MQWVKRARLLKPLHDDDALLAAVKGSVGKQIVVLPAGGARRVEYLKIHVPLSVQIAVEQTPDTELFRLTNIGVLHSKADNWPDVYIRGLAAAIDRAEMLYSEVINRA